MNVLSLKARFNRTEHICSSFYLLLSGRMLKSRVLGQRLVESDLGTELGLCALPFPQVFLEFSDTDFIFILCIRHLFCATSEPLGLTLPRAFNHSSPLTAANSDWTQPNLTWTQADTSCLTPLPLCSGATVQDKPGSLVSEESMLRTSFLCALGLYTKRVLYITLQLACCILT